MALNKTGLESHFRTVDGNSIIGSVGVQACCFQTECSRNTGSKLNFCPELDSLGIRQ